MAPKKGLGSLAEFLRRRFLRHTAIYVFFAFLNKGVAFLMLPIFTRTLSLEDYGAYALLGMAVTICDPLMTFCVLDPLMLVYYNGRFPIREYVSTCILWLVLMLCLHGVVLGALVVCGALPTFFLAVPVMAFSQILTVILQSMWIIQERPLPLGIFNLVCAVLKFSLLIAATVILRAGLPGVLCAELAFAAVGILVVILTLAANGWLGKHFNASCLRFGLRLGLGYFPFVLGTSLNQSMGRFFLADRFSLADVGLYSMGERLGAIIGIYGDSLNNVYGPWLFRTIPHPGSRRRIVLSIPGVGASIALAALGAVGFVWLFRAMFLSGRFAGSIVFVSWAACAWSMSSFYHLLANLVFYTGKTWILSLLMAVIVAFNALTTWVFMGRMGILGVACAPALTWFIALVMVALVILGLREQIWGKTKDLGER